MSMSPAGGITLLELPPQAIRDQRRMVSVLAIEQLTGVVASRAVTLGAMAVVEVGVRVRSQGRSERGDREGVSVGGLHDEAVGRALQELRKLALPLAQVRGALTMITLDAVDLIFLGVSLVVIGLWVGGRAGPNKDFVSRLSSVLASIFILTGVCAVLAAVFLWLIAALGPRLSDLDTLASLNARVRTFERVAAVGALSIIMIGVTALLMSVWGWLSMRKATQHRYANLIRQATAIKYCAGLFASCSFVIAGLSAYGERQVAEAEQEVQRLRDAQLALFRKIDAQVTEGLLEKLIEEDPTAKSLVEAFAVLEPYLVSPQGLHCPLDIAGAGTGELGTDRQAVNRTCMELAQARQQRPQHLPDLSQKAIDDFNRSLPAEGFDSTDKRPLAHALINAAVGETLSEFLGKVVGLENPLLSDIVVGVVQTVVGAKLEGRISGAILSERTVEDVVNRVISDARVSISITPPDTGNSWINVTWSDEAQWENVQQRLKEAVERGLRGRGPGAQELARSAIGEYEAVRGAGERLLAYSPQKARTQEEIRARYLSRNPNYAALWGYGVIAFVPRGLEERLKEIAVVLLRDQSPKVLESFRDRLAARERGDKDAKRWLFERGFADTLTSEATDGELAAAYVRQLGPKPEDGYVLYASKVAGQSFETAIKFFRSEPVAVAVNNLCPK